MSITKFFIGFFFTWLGIIQAGVLGWLLMLITALELVILEELQKLKTEGKK